MGRCWQYIIGASLVTGSAGLQFLKDPGSSSTTSSNASKEEEEALNPHRMVLQNFQNVQYFGEFEIGGQKVTGIFDTGSFELLVRSTRCSGCAHPTTPYDRSLSTTYVKNGTVAQHVFGSGPCVSLKGYEDVAVGPMLSKKQCFWEIIQHQIQALDHAKFAAIVGIGPNFAYGNNDSTLLMNFGVEEFSICLQKPSGSDGFLTWGAVAKQQAKERDYASARVIGKHHWVARMHNVSYKAPTGAHLENVPCMGNGCAAIIDSGTSLIAAPGPALMQLSAQLEPIKEDCSNLHELPTLHFNIDGTDFTLPPEAYVMRVTGAVMEADSIWDILFFKPKLRRVNMCLPAFMQIDMNSQHGPVWILGMPFFRYYHTIFDRTRERMYFALAGEDCKPLPFKNNGTHASSKEALLAVRAQPMGPTSVEIESIVPPTLSEQIDSKDRSIDL